MHLSEICAAYNSSLSNEETLKPSGLEVWGIGLLFVTIISFAAVGGILLMPLFSKRVYYQLLTYFVGLGVGSLSGSAVFHLLPQAYGLLPLDVHHEYLLKSWVAVFGIYLFYTVDNLLKLLVEFRKKKKATTDHSTTKVEITDVNGIPSATSLIQSPNEFHSAISTPAKHPPTSAAGACGDSCHIKISEDENISTAESDMVHAHSVSLLHNPGHIPCYTAAVPLQNGDFDGKTDKSTHAMCTHDHPISGEFHAGSGYGQVIATVAWMIIFGDGLHNFIDGLSIGAAFSVSTMGGISVAVAVLCEEFPHELGDVAILLNAGMTLRQTLVYNFLSACTCYVGFVIGVLAGELPEASPYIFALAGGMFLYISLATMIPEMNSTVASLIPSNTSRALRTLMLQAAGVVTGLVCMFLLSYYSSNIRFE